MRTETLNFIEIAMDEQKRSPQISIFSFERYAVGYTIDCTLLRLE